MWLRKFKIVAQAAGGQSMDLSELRCRFTIKMHGEHGPDKAIIKVTNQNPATARQFCTPNAEYTTISIYCGYQDGPQESMLFSGGIVQAFYGRENPTDTLTTIVATAGHQAHNYATVSKTLPAGSTPQDHVNVAVQAMKKYGLDLGFIGQSLNLMTPKYPRAVMLFGMARNVLANVARMKNGFVSYQNGQIHMLGAQDNLPGGAVVLNSKTGMIGMPTQEIGGIRVRSLINPSIKVHGLIQIDQKSIQQLQLQTGPDGQLAPTPVDLAQIATDGVYKVYLIDVEGDTRGMPWYMDIGALVPSQFEKTGASIAARAGNEMGGSLL
jgi:hypothetical protein